MRGPWAALLAIVVGVLSLSPVASASRNRSQLPAVFLWAWERPTDLRDLAPSTGVAFLAQTIRIAGDHLSINRRRQPLRVAPSIPLIAVTRLESAPPTTAALGDHDVERLAAAVVSSATLPQVSGIQVDFDATPAERAFYRRLLDAIRTQLPRTVPLSITALASWCVGDPWLDDLPIDEAVPMLFRMGPTNEPYRPIASHPDRADAACRHALGVSLDEPIPVRTHGRRLYVFNAAPWTDSSVAAAMELAR